MRSRYPFSRVDAFITTLAIAIVTAMPMTLAAQERETPSFLSSTLKSIALDPTTYAPAVIGYDGALRDWNSSQAFFARGYTEHNPTFTVSGRPDDIAVGYGEGKHRILMDGLVHLQMSVANNFASHVFERILTEKYPEHRKLVRVLGWVERTAFASYLTYQMSALHYRQWRTNEQIAQRMGY